MEKSDASIIFLKKSARFALINLLLVALSGLLLRLFPLISFKELNFNDVLHGHSHFAFAGWVFLALFVSFLYAFSDNRPIRKVYRWQFWLMQVAAFGMLLTFPVQGYAAGSIAFSTLFVLVSYWFAYSFHHEFRNAYRGHLSFRFAKSALFFLVLSSIGPFSIGPITATMGKGSEWYFNALYFYLHFQYNGWFTFGVFAILFRWLETHGLDAPKNAGRPFFSLLFWAGLLGVALSLLWTKPPIWVYLFAGLAGLLQIAALVPFFRILGSASLLFRRKVPLFRNVFAWSMVAFVLKILMQALSAVPIIAAWTFLYKNLIIGYLHLVLLGFISLFLIAYLFHHRLVQQTKVARLGLNIFVVGIVVTELLLFGHGIASVLNFWMPNFVLILFFASLLLPLGMLMISLPQSPRRRSVFTCSSEAKTSDTTCIKPGKNVYEVSAAASSHNL